MIIIKTKNGDMFVNEKETQIVHHDKPHSMVVIRSQKDGLNCNINDVESVRYFSDTQSVEWKDEGSEIKRLKAELEKVRQEKNIVCNHRSFLSEWFTIYSEALDKIKDSREAERNGKIFKNIDIIIEEVENEYEKSLDEFSKQKK